ncbi:MAG: ribosome assembly cofactor RimP [Muribaculaceae bacterium]|nr:ribosome assembly cofactor RimP [Muribaculaceae bacterium]MDE6558916.1 ribosome assembly cofactor RimP [Muribaculaceae bacterium]
MIDKNLLKEYVESLLADTDCFLTDLTISGDNNIVVEIDSIGAIDIDFCSALSRRIEEKFPRDDEDYELEVGSAGLTAPFKVRKQWEKNVGKDIEVLTTDGKKLFGLLKALTDDSFILATEQKVKREGMKRPVLERLELEIPFADVRRANYDLKF